MGVKVKSVCRNIEEILLVFFALLYLSLVGGGLRHLEYGLCGSADRGKGRLSPFPLGKERKARRGLSVYSQPVCTVPGCPCERVPWCVQK